MSAKLFNRDNPHGTVIAISMELCSESMLRTCSVPTGCRVTLPNMTEVSVLGESVYVRGVNSNFFPVELASGKQYFVHEYYVRTHDEH
jgi:hypothetical protein